MTEKPEQRREPRADVHLAVRFTADGHAWHPGIARTLSPGGLFFTCADLVPARSRVVVDVVLGDGAARGVFRSRATVAHVNKRSGTLLIPGLGLKLEDASPSELERVACAIAAAPGTSWIDVEGSVRWPFDSVALPAGAAAPVPGLRVSLDGDGAFVPLADGLAGLQALATADAPWSSARVAYRDLLLAPTAGFAPSDLDAVVPALDAQTRLLDLLLVAESRPERIPLDRSEALEQCTELLRTPRGSLEGERAAEIGRVLVLVAHLRSCVAARALLEGAPRDEGSAAPPALPDEDQLWLIGPETGAPPEARTMRRTSGGGARLVGGLSSARLAALGAAVLAILGSAAYVGWTLLAQARPDPRAAIGAQEFEDVLALESISVGGDTLAAVVETWDALDAEARAAAAEVVCHRAAARGFRSARFVDRKSEPAFSCEGDRPLVD